MQRSQIDQVRNFFQWFIPGNVQREILPDIENGLVHMANHVTDEERRLMDILDFMCERRLDVRVENGQLLVRPLQPVQENYVVNQVTQIIQFIRNRNIHTLCAGGYIFLSIMRDIYNVYAMTHSPETS